MKKLTLLLAVLLAATLAVACEPRDRGADIGIAQESRAGPVAPAPKPAIGALPTPLPAPAPPAPPFAPGASASGVARAQAAPAAPAAAPTPGLALDIAQRKVISTASLSVQVADVQGAVAQVRSIAESLGGFVEHLSSSGGAERAQATVTVRVPQPQFFAALERLEALGEVQSRNVGSQDVSEQFIDLEARLKSAQRQEQSLLSLLQKAQNVSEILTIERELTRIRGEIERLQGQLNFLSRRVELATIAISLLPPKPEIGQPPSASLSLETSRVTERVEAIKERAAAVKGKVDSVAISVRNGRETAHISFRVFPKDFAQTLTFIEGLGAVQVKDVQEATGGGKEPKEPNAPLTVSLVEEEGPNTGLIVAITAPIGGVALAGLLGFLFMSTYRAGQRRARPS